MTATPRSQTAKNSAIERALNENPLATFSGGNHPRRDGQNRPGTTLSGKMKLRDVATQIQYFVVALPRCIDVRSHAAIQTTEAYRRWISMECGRLMVCASFSCWPRLRGP